MKLNLLSNAILSGFSLMIQNEKKIEKKPKKNKKLQQKLLN